MLERFTHIARVVIEESFRSDVIASEVDILRSIARQPRSFASQVLASVGAEADLISPGRVAIDRLALITEAVEQARRYPIDYVGTEHVLLALARNPESGLYRLGVVELLEQFLIESGGSRRIGTTRRCPRW
jgi:hypothetical protein